MVVSRADKYGVDLQMKWKSSSTSLYLQSIAPTSWPQTEILKADSVTVYCWYTGLFELSFMKLIGNKTGRDELRFAATDCKKVNGAQQFSADRHAERLHSFMGN